MKLVQDKNVRILSCLVQKVDGKNEINLGEGEVPFTVKEAKEIIDKPKNV